MKNYVTLALLPLINLSSFAVDRINNSNYSISTMKRPHVVSTWPYTPKSGWMFSHCPFITHFNGRFIAMWSNGIKDEDKPKQRILITTSKDAVHWTSPMPLEIPSKDHQLIPAGFYSHNGRLVAYFSESEIGYKHPKLYAKTSIDGAHWTMRKDLKIPLLAIRGPIKTKSGRLIMCGSFAFPYTDIPTGLSGWKWAGLQPKNLNNVPDDLYSSSKICKALGFNFILTEGVVYQTTNRILHSLNRCYGPGFNGYLWQSQSLNNGKTWSKPTESRFTNGVSKVSAGRLSSGYYYCVGNPDKDRNRTRLVLSLSKDGINFSRHYLIGEKPHKMIQPGRDKMGQYAYPDVLEYNHKLYIIVSRCKEAIEVITVPLSSLD